MSKFFHITSSRRTWAWPYVLFLILFVVLPLLIMGVYAFTDVNGHFTLSNFLQFPKDHAAIVTFWFSLKIALLNTLICLIVGYPAAYIMANESFKTPKVMAILFILPMWINLLLRTFATKELFNLCGLPLNEGALLFGLCYDFLPFMIYPIYNTLQKMDKSLMFNTENVINPSMLLESDRTSVCAGYIQRYYYGLHAYRQHVRYCGDLDEPVKTIIRFSHSG